MLKVTSMKSVYESKDYKQFIRAALESPRFGRGARTKLASFLGVQLSFISLVLAGDLDFAPEHGMKIAQFFELNEEETEYLILMIQRDRAGSPDLKKFTQNLLNKITQARSEIQNRVKKSDRKKLSTDQLMEYYGAWFHTAVHMVLRNPEKRDPDVIAETLMVSRKDVKKSLETLEKLGFISVEKGKIVPLDQRFHLGEHPLALRVHHTNWRQACVRSLDEGDADDLHYTSVMSIDREAAEKIKAIFLESVEKMEPAIMDASDRDVYAICMDLFKVS